MVEKPKEPEDRGFLGFANDWLAPGCLGCLPITSIAFLSLLALMMH
jgi:hypothetical protein